MVAVRDGNATEVALGANATPDQVAALFVLLLGNTKLQRLDMNHNAMDEEYILRIAASFFALNRRLKTLLMEGACSACSARRKAYIEPPHALAP